MASGENDHKVCRLPVPPQKIACGVYHTILISNVQSRESANKYGAQSPEGDAGDAAASQEPLEEFIDAYAHGGNNHNMMGFADKPFKKEKGSTPFFQDFLLPTRVVCKDFAAHGDLYEVACGNTHSMYLLKKPDNIGGILFGAGCGNRGRLSIRQPGGDGGEIEDPWFSEEGPMGPIRKGPGGPPLSVLRVCCGSDHTIAFSTDGRLYAFGANKEGQCGVEANAKDFSDVRQPSVVKLPLDKPLKHYACGAQHCICIVGDGEMYSWGCGRNGRLGLGRSNNCATPHKVPPNSENQCLFVAAGEAHTGMIDQAGKAWTWGAGSYGRLGHGEEEDVMVPKQVELFDEMTEPAGQIRILTMALGGFHSLFLEEPGKMSGRLFSCGSGTATGLLSEHENSNILVPRLLADSCFGTKGGIKQIAAGMYHNYVLQENGDVIRWGNGSSGRLGQNDGRTRTLANPEIHKFLKGFALSHQGAENTPFTHKTERLVREKPKKSEDDERQAGSTNVVKQVECGAMHTMALIKGGQLYVWGSNASGQLGLGADPANSLVKIPRKMLVGTRKVKEIAAGFDHCLAVTFHAECWSWGKGTSGQLGTGRARDSYEPAMISTLHQVMTVSAGEEHSAAICQNQDGDSALWTWGSAESGMLGLGPDFSSGPQSSPTKVVLDTSQMVAGRKKAASKNRASTDANGSESQFEPVKVRCGNNHTALVVAEKGGANSNENKLLTFGGGWYGRLGHGDRKNQYSPREVKFQESVYIEDISCGAYHTCCLNKQGDLYAWGRNNMLCESEHVLAPRKFLHIEGQPQLKLVVCSENHTCALTRKGELWVWGIKSVRELGIEFRDDAPQPEQAKMPAACLMVSSGTGHMMCVCGAGELYGCGNQTCGRLGLESKEDKMKYVLVPTKVQAEWASIQSMTALAAEKKEAPRSLDKMFEDLGHAPEEHEQDKEEPKEQEQEQMASVLKVLGAGQTVTSFGTMQALIKQEQEHSRPANLRKKEVGLEEALQKEVQKIKDLAKDDVLFDQLEKDLKQSLESNMRYFKSCTTPETGNMRVGSEVLTRLPVFEQLIWVLQQQVCYLARLSGCVANDVKSREVFYRVIEGVFKPAFTVSSNARVRDLFLMCTRLMFAAEVSSVSRLTIDKVFDKESSRAFHVFSRFCLSSAHWHDLLHKYMSNEDQNSLIMQFKQSADRAEFFAIGLNDFKQVLAEFEGRADNSEIHGRYVIQLDAFKDFMINLFLTSIEQVTLPSDLRLLFSLIHQDVTVRQPSLGEVDVDIPAEVKIYEPVLYLFIHGIVVPMLRDCKIYCDKTCLLLGSKEMANDAQTYSNISKVAQFLERMVTDDFPAKDLKTLSIVAKQVKLKLLEYLQQQCEVPNDLEARLLVETYSAHYHRHPHFVFLQISDILKLSNMLKLYDSQLRLSEHDKIAALMHNVPKWSEADIKESEEKGTDCLVNLLMNHRFLLTCKEEIVICQTSQIPVPASMASNGAVKGFFKPYRLDNPSDPRRALESLFLELAPMNAQTFYEMKVEFEAMRLAYRQGGSPNYELMQRLQDGLRIVEELENVQAHPQDVLHFMSTSLMDRDTHYQYLKQIDYGLKDMKNVIDAYKKDTKIWQEELKMALDQSRELSLPGVFAKMANMTQLKFEAIKGAKKKSLFDAEKTKALQLSFTPIKSFPVKKLESMGVVTEIFAPFASKDFKSHMHITLRATPGDDGGGVQLEVTIVKKGNTTTVKTIRIPDSMLVEMKSAEEGTKTPLGNPGEIPFLSVLNTKFLAEINALSMSTGA